MSNKKDELSKQTAHRLFDTLKKSRQTVPHEKKEGNEEGNGKALMAQIAQDIPVNALMLNQYLDELQYLDDALLQVLTPKKNTPTLQENDNVEIIDMGNNHVDKNDIENNLNEAIITKLRSTMVLLAYVAMYQGKLGTKVKSNDQKDPCLLDKIELCYKKICILEGKNKNIQENEYLNYLGLLLGYELLKIEQQLTESTIKSKGKQIGAISAEIINRINQKRLFWVGLGSMISPLTKLLSGTMLDGDKMVTSASTLGQHTGRMSFILYFIRFPLHVFMLIFKTFDSRPDHEKLPLKARLKAAWAEHGGYIWNDFFWAPINFITYFFLTGKGSAGFAGNMVTMGAFVISDAAWNFINWGLAAKQYRTDLRAMNSAINKFFEDNNDVEDNIVINNEQLLIKQKRLELNTLIHQSNQKIEEHIRKNYKQKETESVEAAEAVIQQMLAIALAAKKMHFEYQYKRNEYLIGAMQGLLNATAIAMMTFSIFPPILGPIVYIATNILINILNGANTIAKMGGKIKLLKEEEDAITAQINIKENDPLLKEKRAVIQAEIKYLEASRNFQRLGVVGKIMLDLAVTVGVYVAFALAPFGIGIAIAVSILVIAAILEKVAENINVKYINQKLVSEKSLFLNEIRKKEEHLITSEIKIENN